MFFSLFAVPVFSFGQVCVFVAFLIALTKYLRKATQGRKVSFLVRI